MVDMIQFTFQKSGHCSNYSFLGRRHNTGGPESGQQLTVGPTDKLEDGDATGKQEDGGQPGATDELEEVVVEDGEGPVGSHEPPAPTPDPNDECTPLPSQSTELVRS